MEEFVLIPFLITLASSAIRLLVPIMIPAIGEIFVQKSGVLNLGIEGMMLVSSVVGLGVAIAVDSIWAGVLVAAFAGVVIAAFFALWVLYIQANQVVCGFALNILGAGLSIYLYRVFFGIRSVQPKVTVLAAWKIPILGDIPIIGDIFFNQSPLVYIAYILLPISILILEKTKFGLAIRAVGENPEAADTRGINVNRTRLLCILIGGAMAGIGGAFLSLAFLGTFYNGMTAGRGFIAVAIVILSKWNPKNVFGSALLFGGAYSLQYRLQALGAPVPYQLLVAFPYILTLIVLVGVSKRTQTPSALTVPYSREKKE